MRTAPPVRSRRRQFGPGGGSSVEAEAVRSRRRADPAAFPTRPGTPEGHAPSGRSTGPKGVARYIHAKWPRRFVTWLYQAAEPPESSAASPPPGSQGPWPPRQWTVGERPGAAPARGPPAIDPGQSHPAINPARATPPSTRPEPPRHRPEPGRHATCSRPPRLPNDRIGRHRCSPPTYRAVVRARVTGPTPGYSTLTFAAPDLSNHEQSW